jgi:hypothetical protein
MKSALLSKRAFTGYPNEVELLESGGDRLFETDSLRQPGQRMLVAIAEDGSVDYPVFNPEKEKVKWKFDDRFGKKFKSDVKKHMMGEVEKAETPKEEEEATNDPVLRTASKPQKCSLCNQGVPPFDRDGRCGACAADERPKPSAKRATAVCPTCGSIVKCNCPPPPKKYKFERTPEGRMKMVHAAKAASGGKQMFEGEMGRRQQLAEGVKEYAKQHFNADGMTVVYDILDGDESLETIGDSQTVQQAVDRIKGMVQIYDDTAPRHRPHSAVLASKKTAINRPGVDEVGPDYRAVTKGKSIYNEAPPNKGVDLSMNTLSNFTVHDLKPLLDELRNTDALGNDRNIEEAIQLTRKLIHMSKQVGARGLREAARHYLSIIERITQHSLSGSAGWHAGVNPIPPRTKRAHDRAWKRLEAEFVHFVR